MQCNQLTHWIRISFFILLASILSSCGTGDGEESLSDPEQVGILLDSPVSGVTFQTGSLSGLTNTSGEFSYKFGEMVTFSIGGIKLGTDLRPVPYITPVEITGSSDASDPNVIRLLRLLQSLDADSDHSNGITISAATRNLARNVSFDFGDPSFSTSYPAFDLQALVSQISDPSDTTPLVVSEATALQNFKNTVTGLNLNIKLTASYQLAWADEFNAFTLDTENTWNFETGYGPNNDGWGNDEWQEYTQNSDNLSIVFEDQSDAANGYLKISAQCPAPGVDNAACQKRDGSITSAKINTRDKQEFQFGKIEARIKVPTGKGAWPAFWSLGAGFPDTPWPAAGEIDFMEVFSVNNSTDKDGLFTIHWEQTDGQGDRQYVTSTKVIDASEFHVFESEWSEDRIIGKIDGVVFASYPIDPATQSEFLDPFYLILNVAMGGNPLPDLVPDASTIWPQEMLVDYVRVYQAVGDFGADILNIGFEGASEFDCFFDGASCGEATGFAGADVSIQPNPDIVGNPSANAARFLKFNPNNGETWSGTVIGLNDSLISYLDQSNKIFTMKVWSSRAVTLDFLLQTTPGNGPRKIVTTDGSGWQEFTFDFSADDMTGVTALVLIFGNGESYDSGDAQDDLDNGTTQWTFYFDDIVLQTSVEDNGDTGGGTVIGDGTGLGVFSETNTNLAVTNTNIVSAGNTVVIDGASTAVTPFDGDVVLSLEYQAGTNGYGGAVFEFDAVDLSAYNALKFTIDTSGITDFTNLTLQIEPPAGGTAGGNVLLGAYTPVATSGNWKTYEIPFADFTAVTFTAVTKLGFFNLSNSAGLTTGTIYLDDIHFALVADECVVIGGGGELAVNGGFDSNFTGWAQYPSAETTQTIIVDSTTSSNVARLYIPPSAGGVNNVLKQERLEDGNGVFSAGDVINISFDYRGEPGEGILFVKSICETASGTCGDYLHNAGGPFTPTSSWTAYSDTFTLGVGVTGYTLEFAAVCGGTGTCVADYFIDNVSISIEGTTASRTANLDVCVPVGGGTAPTVAATTPTATGTLSVFSDAYTDVTGVDYNPNWGQATVVTTESIAGNDVLKLATLNYQGIDFVTNGTAQDVSGMDTLHIDFWTADATAVNVALISTGPAETAYALPISTGSWQSVDIPLSSFSGVNLADVIQMKFDDNGTGEAATIYIDNIYFFNSADSGSSVGAELTTNGDFETGNLTGWTEFPGGGSISADNSQANGGTYSGKLVASAGQDVIIKQANIGIGTVNASDTITVSFDLYGSLTGVGGVVFAEFFSELSGGGTSSAEILEGGPLTPTTTWTTYSYTVTAGSDVSGGITLQLKAGCGAVDGCGVDAYFDNVSITAGSGGGGTGGDTAPTVAATTPTATGTLSVFSDAYTDVTGVDYNPNWGQATVVTTESIAGNDVLKLATLNYQGIDFVTNGTAQDVSGMDTLHIDFWTADATAVNVALISTGPAETAYALPISTGSWQSVDIPLSSFSGVNLADVIQMKFDDNGTGEAATIFIDNVYFYTNAAPATAPTVAATTPTATGTLSVFSDAYTDVTGVDYNPNWGQATVVTTESIAGNDVLKLATLNYQGIDFVTNGSAQDVSGMDTLHIDFWTADATAVNVALISTGPAETAYALPISTGSWQSVDIPLSSFSGVNLADVIQMKFDDNGTGEAATIFIDNIYFFNSVL